MTDGILLAEIGSDRNLHRYDTLIIDEAHERSLNIDFILGYLKQLLPRRPDLKVIITSATIDPERFAEHFGDPRTQQPAPIVEVSGRTYPVEVRYRPVNDPEAAPRRRPRPGPGHHRRHRRTGTRRPRRHPRLPLRRAGDPRHRRRPGGQAQARHPPALLPAVRRRAAPRLRTAPIVADPPDRARHQRRRDLAHRARHPLRDRPRHRPHQPLQPPHQGAAAADRGDLAGLRQPAQGPLRPRRRRHLHPALLPGRLRVTARVHRPRDPAHQPRLRHPPDGRRAPRRRPQIPLRRPARPPRDHRRRPAPGGAQRHENRPADRHRPPDGAAPRRPPHRPDDHRVRPPGLRPRDPRHRRRALDPGPPRAPDRQPAGGRHRPPPLRPARIRLHRVHRALGLPGRTAARADRLRVPPPVPVRVPQLPARPRVAGPARPARSRSPASSGSIQNPQVWNGPWFTRPCSPVCSPTSA